jgi:hypothetical protein
MNHKLVGFQVKGGGSFKARYVAAMTEFCLRVSTDNVQAINLRHPELLLLFARKSLYALGEHRLMQVQWIRRMTECKMPFPQQ